MKSLSKIAISITFIFAMLFFSTYIKVYAATPVVSLEGEKEVEVGKIQTISVKIVNNDGIGVIQGKVNGDSNIEIVNVEAKDSKWVVNYNSKTKQFDGFCAEGVKNGEVINIKYKLKENAKQGTIEVSDIILTTLKYNTLNEGKFEKVVDAKTTSENNDNNQQNNNENKQPGKAPQNNSNGNQIITTTTNEVKNKNNNSSNGIIPKLGQSGIILICIIASVLFAAISHKRLKNKRK